MTDQPAPRELLYRAGYRPSFPGYWMTPNGDLIGEHDAIAAVTAREGETA